MMEVRFEATDGTDLEGHLLPASGETRGVAVCCHPHPQFGGSMDTWMPPVLQEALADDGWTTLRFNFRGVELSEGSFEGGVGEVEDVLGAIAFLLDHVGDAQAPVFVTGWSFGALVGLVAAMRDERVVGWAGVAPPVGSNGPPDVALPELHPEALEAWDRPSCWVIGTRDPFSSVEDVRAAASPAGERATVEVVDGDHFLLGRAEELRRLVVEHGRRCPG